MDGEELAFRLKSLFLPVIGASLLLLGVYSALNWMAGGAVPLDDYVIDYWLPMSVAALLTFLLATPKIRVLMLNEKYGISFYYNLAAFALIAAPTVLAQGYIRTAHGDLTHVTDAAQIASAPATRFYAADKTCLDNTGVGVQVEVTPGGRNNEYLEVEVFAAVPVCTPQVHVPGAVAGNNNTPGKMAAGAPPKVWMGLKYSTSLDNTAGKDERMKAYKVFAKKTDDALAAATVDKDRYFEKIGPSADRRNFVKAVQSLKLANAPAPIILVPHAEAFEQRNGDQLTYALGALAIGALVWLVMIFVPLLDPDLLEAEQKGERPDFSKSPAGMFLVPHAESYGLQVLIDLNLIVFLAMVFAGLGVIAFSPDDLIVWGGNYGPELHGLGILRLVSSTFVHGGLMHLANNMYGLVMAGIFLAPVLNNGRLILCYLITGIGGSIAGALVHPEIVGVGASGAILGFWGILLSLALLKDPRLAEMKNGILRSGAIFVVLTLILGGMTPGIDNAAHIGGFLTGMAAGAGLYWLNRRDMADNRAAS